MRLAVALAALSLSLSAPAPALAGPPADGWDPRSISQFVLRTRAQPYQPHPVDDRAGVAALAGCLAAATRSDREDLAGATHYLDVLGRTPRAGRWMLHAGQGWLVPLGVARPTVLQLDERCRAEVLAPRLPR